MQSENEKVHWEAVVGMDLNMFSGVMAVSSEVRPDHRSLSAASQRITAKQQTSHYILL